MLEIVGLDASNPLPVVLNLRPWLDQCVEHDVAVEVDDRNSSEPVTFLGQDALTVQCKNFGLSTQECQLIDETLFLLTYLPRLSP